ncbi:hypothetical protein RBSH_05438 [Rhodopirellula baltica SH28]|uniref:Membrane-associated protein n=1 Tax=Rhodopirellula baltica SH28 TaxID=993517 RepID=K5DA08_RHOBT|nr:hypothetical protein [Rhodopirellula baltica]EKJ99262.1 hypothetical protein RBSH_05438 [Rhodopirellula baltica SH28]
MNDQSSPQPIPLWIKLAFTAFVAVLTPYYWREYGPTNFLYFCDVALFLAVAAVWTQRPIFASMAAVGITIPQLLWQVDFVGQLFGVPATGMTDYMFDPGISLFARGLSFFHFWLPILLLYLVWRLGYDRRALVAWTGTAWLLLLICYFLMPPAGATLDFPNQPHNINYVYGMDDTQPQQWMPPQAWLGMLFIGLPALLYYPTHLALKTFLPNHLPSKSRKPTVAPSPNAALSNAS